MSNGYTPLFGSLTTGTLCGKWPDIGLWAIVLALADWQGVVDATPHYISNVTGLPVIEVKACMQRFCEPDPDSRSKVESGARLMLVDPQREWGWRVVNIQLYRDRASGKDQIMDGRNAEKVRRYKERHRQTPPDTGGHPGTPTHTADSYSESEKTSEQPRKRSADTQRGSRIPIPFPVTEPLLEWAKSETPDVDVTAATAEFVDYWRAVPGQKGCKIDWIATWRNRMREKQGRAKQFGKPNGKRVSEWQ